MKKILFGLIAMFICTGLFAQQLTVAVSTFEARGGLTKDDADAITELFISALVSNGTVKVVDRNSFDARITEMKFQASDWTNGEMVAQLGRSLNANSIIRGSVMSLAGQLAVTTTILEINTGQIISSSTLSMSNFSEIFDKLPPFVINLMKNLPGAPDPYKIGDRGPGGGFIFYAEGGLYMEVSLTLGTVNWDQAIELANNYKGGGYSDWRLPSRDELNRIYVNLRSKNLAGLGNDTYWSSSLNLYNSNSYPYYQKFSNGVQNTDFKSNAYSVRAVRAF